MEPSPAQRAARDRIAAELAAAGFALPGTLTVRAYACGKPGCRCHADPPRLHGPYAEWTRKIGGKTVTRRLTPRELAEYQPLFDNAKKLRALLAELQDLTLEIVQADSSPGSHEPDEPEASPPENVASARLTCGQHPRPAPFPQVRPKREDLTLLTWGFRLQVVLLSELVGPWWVQCGTSFSLLSFRFPFGHAEGPADAPGWRCPGHRSFGQGGSTRRRWRVPGSLIVRR